MKPQIWIAVLLLAAAVTPAAAEDAAKGNAQAGKVLFLANGCYSCHGTVGQGSPRTGPAIGATELPLTVFAQRLRTPVSEMPPYTAKVLTDAQVSDIYAYVKGLPPPPDYKAIKLLQQ
jgi:ubiquinol-cytochrome c reductase cytochrome c subunit